MHYYAQMFLFLCGAAPTPTLQPRIHNSILIKFPISIKLRRKVTTVGVISVCISNLPSLITTLHIKLCF
jgi:hypothetical protein